MGRKNRAQAQDRDLFGNPIEPLKDRRGRPSFAKTKENQDFVSVRAAAGWSQKMIAEALGCDEQTLRKHFSRELQGGRLMVEGMCLDVLLRRVREGHAPSIRQLLERFDGVAAPGSAPRGKGTGAEADAAKAEPKGKKERRLEAAAQPAPGYGDLYDRIRRQ